MTIVQSQWLDSVLFRIYLQAQRVVLFMVALVPCISSTHSLNLYYALVSVEFLAMYCIIGLVEKCTRATLRYDMG